MNKKIILSFSIPIIFLMVFAFVWAQENQNNVETRIEIKIDGKIDEIQKAKINDFLEYFKNQNPRLKIKSENKEEGPETAKNQIEKRESKVEKYYFWPITILALIIIFTLWLFTETKKEKRFEIKMLSNIFMGVIFLFVAISGILLIYGYKFQAFDLKFWHVITSLILVFIIIFHVLLHWNTWLTYLKKIFQPFKKLK